MSENNKLLGMIKDEFGGEVIIRVGCTSKNEFLKIKWENHCKDLD